jgi:hypothetical protein
MQGQLRETQRDDFRFLKRRSDMHAAILVVVFLFAGRYPTSRFYRSLFGKWHATVNQIFSCHEG